MSFDRPFSQTVLPAAAAVAALMLLAPVIVLPARAQAAQQPAVSGGAPGSNAANAPAAQAGAAGPAPSLDQANPAQQKSLTTRAIEKVKQVAKSASDIFSRVPCLPPKGGAKSMGSLPHVAGKLAAGRPVVIVAFGSSSTQGWGSSSPEFTYPNRLAAQLRRHYPGADITVLNHGVGGEDVPEMMKRLQTSVIDAKPDLVIWQVGTNAVLRNLDPAETAKLVEEGVARIQAAGADLVLVDPQYSPRVTEHGESAHRMVKLLGRVAELRHVGIFPRFEVMREWHDRQDLPINSFVIADGLHMNDWGYACFAQLLGDDIIKSVGQIKLGVNVPAQVQTYRPM
ncbi:MAG: SGNH/GDSL hydrolase family protein [Bradyrhizobium sp.]|uniref:SGNH/GDSL hydrolase family protein n=1 Tax=Bradyrhizobium sp. TaxID=376 RepID=UPI001C29D1B3|nr:SGNH/GDSL hydrolase family protein [Bradyrhizobium sp.]MBU6462153.1 SGNH/GDSL hydrolase family protein [Pseudomonadota bacterium]MDE2067154.1 SGNH/GDSL hydrolase family protein [Bradyrhizobium sp.]MDE2240877.1 SGNH/GDSL hydrolase family protein [Bradyrhizobium sp.]MDE2472382.1 SGNH/GDSL hydrolase family protein [Bradyrhizobium sp.]